MLLDHVYCRDLEYGSVNADTVKNPFVSCELFLKDKCLDFPKEILFINTKIRF